MSRNSRVSADWWERPAARPSTPSDGHDRLPSPTTQIVPTSQPTQPQPTPTGSHVGGLPSPTPTQGTSSDGKSTDDPCASGKSYSGPYCGWSPSVGIGDGTSSNNDTSQLRIGGPKVLGLSNTSGEDLNNFDIIALAGILCLLLYVRSKLPQVFHQ